MNFFKRVRIASKIAFNKELRGANFSFSNFDTFVKWLSGSTVDEDSGENVTPERGSKLSTVFSCLNVVAQDVAVLPKQVRRKTENGVEVVNDQVSRLIHSRPNRYMNAYQFWFLMAFIGEGWGESLAYISRDGNDRPQELIPIRPGLCQDKQIVDGELYYVIDNKAIHSRNIFFYSTFTMDGINGLSKIIYNGRLLGYSMKQSRHSSRSLGSQIPGVLIGKDFTEDQSNNAVNYFESFISGKNKGKTPFLFGDVAYEKFMLSPEAVQAVESGKWTDQKTYSIWRVQPVMVSQHEDSNYSNAEQQNIIHATYTLSAAIIAIEQECNYKLFSERNKESDAPKYVKVNFKGLLRGDLKTQAEYIRTVRTLGINSADEIREWNDEPKQKESDKIGEKYLIQGAMIPVDQITENTIQNQQQRILQSMADQLKQLGVSPSMNGHGQESQKQ